MEGHSKCFRAVVHNALEVVFGFGSEGWEPADEGETQDTLNEGVVESLQGAVEGGTLAFVLLLVCDLHCLTMDDRWVHLEGFSPKVSKHLFDLREVQL